MAPASRSLSEAESGVENTKDSNHVLQIETGTETSVPFALGPPPTAKNFSAFVEALWLGADVQLAPSSSGTVSGGSAYAAYRAWLACLSAYCGWGSAVPAPQESESAEAEAESGRKSARRTQCGVVLEMPKCDVLRIPSTRNWSIVGHARASDADAGGMDVYEARARALLRRMEERGIFKTMRPEGKAGGIISGHLTCPCEGREKISA